MIFSQAVTVALALLFVVATLKPQWLQRSPAEVLLPQVVSIATAPVASSLPASGVQADHAGYAAAARRAAPSVVSITALKAPQRAPDDPWSRFFFRHGAPQEMQPQRGLGSGVIVAPEGYLLTNNHVIDGADEIQVQLVDGRQATAKLIGTDPESDVAVLRIELDRLPAITFGDVGRLQVGDIVLAIGNPFAVGQTVTSGIVSALGRNRLGINTYENFIQTDAAINPGNSGGALVDVNGNLVGINTAIYSRSGGNLGIGFAIPADGARQIMESLIRDGVVRRGWIGVETRELTPEIAEAFQLPKVAGVLIAGVLQDGPAGRAGVRPGDVVVKIGDTPVATPQQLQTAVSKLQPQEEATLSVQRGGEQLELRLRVAQRPSVARPQQPR